jgi:PAS domain S-box-containing protein
MQGTEPSLNSADQPGDLIDVLPDAALAVSVQGLMVQRANPAAARLFGFEPDQLVGMPLVRLLPDGLPAPGQASSAVWAQPSGQLGLRGQHADGHALTLEACSFKWPWRGQPCWHLVLRDVSQWRSQQAEALRLTRLYEALIRTNQAIVHAETPQALTQAVCEALVERGGFHLAWVGWPDRHSTRLLPTAQAGKDGGYLERIVVTTDEQATGRGPAGLAYRTGQPHVSNDFIADQGTEPWRGAAIEHGIRASASLPIRLDGRVLGVLTVYAAETNYFQKEEMALLMEVAEDLAFALDALTHAQARHQAERQARQEQMFSQAMTDSTPGILYFYDEHGRFLRWNRNFEQVSGYSGAEIAHMHPLDFFDDVDKPLLTERIAEVHVKGEASVEADFVSKDGRRTPYYFTGKRLMYEGRPCLIGVGIDITARRQAQSDLEEQALRLRHMSRQLMEVQEGERRMLARDLHDSVGQELTALSLNLSIIAATLPADASEALSLRLNDSLKLLEDTTAHLRHVMVSLRPPGLDELGLMAAIKEHARRVSQRSDIKLSLQGADPRPRLPSAFEIALFRIVQEALNNTVKHAQASEVAITLEASTGLLTLCVADNGQGFDSGRRPGRGIDRMGMSTMRERAEAIGASLHVETALGQGTRITVALPTPAP